MKELTAREVQLGELEVMKQLDWICKKLNLRYYLYFGTLLGAVRHQGFIPWDDDIDVALPRPDYEVLIAYLQENEDRIAPLKLMSCRNVKNYIYPIARLCDTRYYIEYQNTVQYGLGLFVDIYPLDGCGNSDEDARVIQKKNASLQTLISLAGESSFRPSFQGGLIRSTAKLLVYGYAKLMGAPYFAKKLEKNSLKLDFNSCKYYSCTVWDMADAWFKKDTIEECCTAMFEGYEFSIPCGYDKMLKAWYGDYMQLPPENQQIAHHYYTAYLKDKYI